MRLLEPPADRIDDPVADRHEVARDQDGLIEHLVPAPRLERQRRGRHGAFHGLGDSRVHLARQRDRPIGRDARRLAADQQLFRGAHRRGPCQGTKDHVRRDEQTTGFRVQHDCDPHEASSAQTALDFETLTDPLEAREG